MLETFSSLQLPYWIEHGETLTESQAILKYIAMEKTSDLMPKDPVLLRKADMIENVLYDVWMALIRRLVQDSACIQILQFLWTIFGSFIKILS
jgi:glutathione S-transferase